MAFVLYRAPSDGPEPSAESVEVSELKGGWCSARAGDKGELSPLQTEGQR